MDRERNPLDVTSFFSTSSTICFAEVLKLTETEANRKQLIRSKRLISPFITDNITQIFSISGVKVICKWFFCHCSHLHISTALFIFTKKRKNFSCNFQGIVPECIYFNRFACSWCDHICAYFGIHPGELYSIFSCPNNPSSSWWIPYLVPVTWLSRMSSNTGRIFLK